MNANIDYKGHSISADTRKVGQGYGWRYVIDGTIYRESRDRPLQNEELMLKEAIDEAKWAIDAMPPR